MKQYIILAALSQSLEYQAISDKTREGKVFCISVYVSLHMSISPFDIWLLQRLYNVACSRYLDIANIRNDPCSVYQSIVPCCSIS